MKMVEIYIAGVAGIIWVYCAIEILRVGSDRREFCRGLSLQWNPVVTVRTERTLRVGGRPLRVAGRTRRTSRTC